MTNLDYIEIDSIYIENIKDIPIIDVVTYSDRFGFDAIIYKYYPGGPPDANGVDQALRILPLILLFNNIHDITEIKVGTIIRLPSLESLLNSFYITDNEENVPGVQTTQQNIEQKKVGTKSNTRTTTAVPKMNITLPIVSVDYATGKITF